MALPVVHGPGFGCASSAPTSTQRAERWRTGYRESGPLRDDELTAPVLDASDAAGSNPAPATTLRSEAGRAEGEARAVEPDDVRSSAGAGESPACLYHERASGVRQRLRLEEVPGGSGVEEQAPQVSHGPAATASDLAAILSARAIAVACAAVPQAGPLLLAGPRPIPEDESPLSDSAGCPVHACYIAGPHGHGTSTGGSGVVGASATEDCAEGLP